MKCFIIGQNWILKKSIKKCWAPTHCFKNLELNHAKEGWNNKLETWITCNHQRKVVIFYCGCGLIEEVKTAKCGVSCVPGSRTFTHSSPTERLCVVLVCFWNGLAKHHLSLSPPSKLWLCVHDGSLMLLCCPCSSQHYFYGLCLGIKKRVINDNVLYQAIVSCNFSLFF